MNRTMITATNTLAQLQTKLDTISNDIANVNTTGYKKKDSYFQDLLVQQVNNQPNNEKEAGRLTPNGIRQGTGAKLSQTQINLAQGGIKTTGRNMDLALLQEGLFFRVNTQEGGINETRFTRDGTFYLTPVNNNENQLMLVNSSGYPVLDQTDQPIIVNGSVKEINFTEEGRMQVETYNNGTQSFNLSIVNVKKPQFLEDRGNNTFGLPQNMAQLGVTDDDVYAQVTGQGLVQSGALEQSNVDLSKSMTDLISVQRQYQFQSRAVTMADQMMGLINGIR